jgi:hypothetical protein
MASAARRRVFKFRISGTVSEALYEAMAAKTVTTGAQISEPRGVVSNILLFSKRFQGMRLQVARQFR